MKNKKKWRFIVIVLFTILSISSCSKDDEVTNNNASTQNGENPGNGDGSGTNSTGSQGEITLYRVDGENIIKDKDYVVSGASLDFQRDTQKHQEIWSLVKKVVPLSNRSKMSQFMIYSGSVSGSLGYVFNTKQDLTKWEMGIAIDYAYEGGFNKDGELAYTIIHEFGHILTLNNTQVDASISEGNCTNYFVGEGCARTNANINKLHSRFWKDIWGEYTNAQNSESAQRQFYEKYKSHFLTAYASTNPAEDIAEVFATFVTRSGGVNGSSMAEQKIQLMYDDSEMISLRNYIRSHVGRSSKSFLPEPGFWKRASTIGKAEHTPGAHRH